MAHIEKRGNSWRTSLMVAGVRKSASFKTKEAARTWAMTTEADMRSNGKPVVPLAVRRRPERPPRGFDPAEWPDLEAPESLISRAEKYSPITGVYFLVRDGKIVYVGQAVDVLRRIGEHGKSKSFDRFTYIECNERELSVVESRYILAFEPEYNTTSGGKLILSVRRSRIQQK